MKEKNQLKTKKGLKPKKSSRNDKDKDEDAKIKRNNNGNSVSSSKSSTDESNSNNTSRPSVRSIVASSSSWTGKLPQALLHEHCQKLHWERVNYDMKHVRTGFIATVMLSYKNPKTGELETIKYTPPTSIVLAQPTSLEARHMAATYTLHRISSHKNISMALPKPHRDIWNQLEDFRKALVKHDKEKAQREYCTDPFAVQRAWKLQMEKKEAEIRKQKEEEGEKLKPQLIVIGNDNSKQNGNVSKKSNVVLNELSSNVRLSRKTWELAPRLELSTYMRQQIESSIKSENIWSSLEHSKTKVQSKSTNPLVIKQLASLGFRESHCSEALEYIPSGSISLALEWLLVHVPEDDLPDIFLPDRSNKSSSVVAVSINTELKNEYAARRLADTGFPLNFARQVLDSCKGHERKAALKLMLSLIDDENRSRLGSFIEYENISNDDSKGIWKEEIESLIAIYDSKVIILDAKTNDEVQITLQLHDNSLPGMLALHLYRSDNYPNSLPALAINVIDKTKRLPQYIRLSIVKKMAEHLIKSEVMGVSMIFNIIEWAEENIPQIIENPGRLLDIAVAVTGISNENESESESENVTEVKKNGRDYSKNKHKIKSIDIENELSRRMESLAVKKMIESRKNLPAWSKQEEIIDSINKSQITLVTGETGSGKSTQTVQFVMDDMILSQHKGDKVNVICTQPRRISAIGLAERVADERGAICGDEVGYIIRGDKKTNKNTKLTFVTTGVLLRMIQQSIDTNDKSPSILDNLSHIIIDEVHERSVDGDFLLIILKNLLSKSKSKISCKIILMSATIDVSIFQQYFSTFTFSHIHIPGRTFPVKDIYLDTIINDINFKMPKPQNFKTLKKKKQNERLNRNNKNDDEIDYELEDLDNDDNNSNNREMITPNPESAFFKYGKINYDIIGSLVSYIDKQLESKSNNGSILIFMPGIMEINKCISSIMKYCPSSSYLILPLHSALSPIEQRKVFPKIKSWQKRKIIVATNIAETSITISDVVSVIDSGRVKQTSIESNSSKLTEIWCSRAEAKQRRGRAGRVMEGLCYKMYTKSTENDIMLSMAVPEIQRTSLEQVYLSVKTLGVNNVKRFLSMAIDPPSSEHLDEAKEYLTSIGALIQDEFSLSNEHDKLTNLGRYLSLIPIDLKSSKLLIYGCIFGCLEPCLVISSICGNGKGLFINSFEERDKIKEVMFKFSNNFGDLIANLRAYNHYNDLKLYESSSNLKKWMKENFISYQGIRDTVSSRLQLITILEDLNFIPFDYDKDNFDKINDDNHSVTYQSLNRNSDNYSIICAVIAAAFFPNIVSIERPATKYKNVASGTIASESEEKDNKYWIRRKIIANDEDSNEYESSPAMRGFIHPSSVEFMKDKMTNLLNEDIGTISKPSHYVYSSSQVTTKLYLRDITPINSFAALLFGGTISYNIQNLLHSHNKKEFPQGLILDDWMPFKTWIKTGVLVKNLRFLLDGVIQKKLDSPTNEVAELQVIKIVERLLVNNGK